MVEVGDEIAGRYVIRAQLGAGGMGAVYRALDQRLNRDIALKLLIAGQVGDAPAVSRMIREAQATAALEHDHIVPVYDVGPSGDGGAYIAMQLVEGETLRARASTKGITAAEALRVLAEVGDALAHAHDAGIVHRDIKPENVMLRASDGRAVVMDFGLARFMEPDPELHTLTAEGTFVGTPAYLAPEQARGLPVDGRADQFALAVMAWELLAGRSPWSGTTLTAILANILADEPERLAEVTEVAPHVSDAVHRALSKDANERFENIRAFIAALREPTTPDERPATTNDDAALLDTVQASAAALPTVEGPARSRRPLIWGAITLVTAGGLALISNSGTDTSLAADAGGGTRGVGLMELPKPVGCNDAALDHYDEGIRALHDGNAGSARAAFIAAIDADDDCAAAHLRRVTSRSWRDDEELVRRSFQRAGRFRNALSPRDLGLLDAFSELHLGEGGTREGLQDALWALAGEFDDDAEILRIAATSGSGHTERRLAMLDRALQIDANYALAWVSRAGIQAEAGNMEAAHDAASECTRRFQSSADCHGVKIHLLLLEKRCAEILPSATAAVRAQGSAEDHLDMAEALACAGRSPEAIDRELRSAAQADFLRHEILPRQIDRAFLSGDLAMAERLADEALEIEDLPTTTRTSVVARAIEALWEQGRDEEARARAATQLRSVDGADGYVGQGWYTAADHLRVHQIARGGLSEEESRDLFARFVSEVSEQLYLDAYDVSLITNVGLVESAEEAVARLGLLTEASEQPTATSRALEGRALQLAGRHEEAVSSLTEVIAGCHCLQLPLWRLRARLWRAQAYVALGRHQEACEDARVVADAWAESAPRSRVATTASSLLDNCE